MTGSVLFWDSSRYQRRQIEIAKVNKVFKVLDDSKIKGKTIYCNYNYRAIKTQMTSWRNEVEMGQRQDQCRLISELHTPSLFPSYHLTNKCSLMRCMNLEVIVKLRSKAGVTEVTCTVTVVQIPVEATSYCRNLSSPSRKILRIRLTYRSRA
jgi:hypothetical protein